MDASSPRLDPAALHKDALVWDMTLPWRDYGRQWLKRDTLPRFKQAGCDVVSLTLASDDHGLELAFRQIARERDMIAQDPDRYALIESVGDIQKAKAAGKLGLLFHFQGTDPFGRDPATVEPYYRLGIRHALLAYNQRNSVGTGCHERSDGGLSRFGVELIRAMNRVGMIVDLSHTGYRTTMEAMDVSEQTVIFSHSNPKALNDHPRNIADDQIRRCAEMGGVIGVNGIGAFIGNNDASSEALIRQIDYLVQLVGSDHVGIGLDFVYDPEMLLYNARLNSSRYPRDGGYEQEIEIARPEQLPEITEGLVRRGYKESDIRKILGMNWLRVASAVWK